MVFAENPVNGHSFHDNISFVCDLRRAMQIELTDIYVFYFSARLSTDNAFCSRLKATFSLILSVFDTSGFQEKFLQFRCLYPMSWLPEQNFNLPAKLAHFWIFTSDLVHDLLLFHLVFLGEKKLLF